MSSTVMSMNRSSISRTDNDVLPVTETEKEGIVSVKDRIRAMNLDASTTSVPNSSTNVSAPTNNSTTTSFRNNRLSMNTPPPSSSSSANFDVNGKSSVSSRFSFDFTGVSSTSNPTNVTTPSKTNTIHDKEKNNNYVATDADMKCKVVDALSPKSQPQHLPEIDENEAAVTLWRRKRVLNEENQNRDVAVDDMPDDAPSESWTLSDLVKERNNQKSLSKPSPNTFGTGNGSVDKEMNATISSGGNLVADSSPASPVKLKPLNINASREDGDKNGGGPTKFVIPKLRPVRRTGSGTPKTNKGGDCVIPTGAISTQSSLPKEKDVSSSLSFSPLTPTLTSPSASSSSTFKMPQLRPVRRNIDNSGATSAATNTLLSSSSSPKQKVEVLVSAPSPKDITSQPSPLQIASNGSTFQMTQLKPVRKVDPTPSHSKHPISPSRSKISDVIKAFNSPKKRNKSNIASISNSNIWKQSSSTHSSTASTGQTQHFKTNNFSSRRPPLSNLLPEDESTSTVSNDVCSDRGVIHNPTVDDDSVSVSTPVNNTPLYANPNSSTTPSRFGVQPPPTPHSNSSSTTYTAASSGDGAVAGSVSSESKLKKVVNKYNNQISSIQQPLLYEHFDTPDVSVQDENSTCTSACSINADDKSVKAPDRTTAGLIREIKGSHFTPGSVSVSTSKSSLLMSKLEGDKRKEDLVRNQHQNKSQHLVGGEKNLKVPEVLVAMQKKTREMDRHHLGSSSKHRWVDNATSNTLESNRTNFVKEDVIVVKPDSVVVDSPKRPEGSRKLIGASPFVLYDKENNSPSRCSISPTKKIQVDSNDSVAKDKSSPIDDAVIVNDKSPLKGTTMTKDISLREESMIMNDKLPTEGFDILKNKSPLDRGVMKTINPSEDSAVRNKNLSEKIYEEDVGSEDASNHKPTLPQNTHKCDQDENPGIISERMTFKGSSRSVAMKKILNKRRQRKSIQPPKTTSASSGASSNDKNKQSVSDLRVSIHTPVSGPVSIAVTPYSFVDSGSDVDSMMPLSPPKINRSTQQEAPLSENLNAREEHERKSTASAEHFSAGSKQSFSVVSTDDSQVSTETKSRHFPINEPDYTIEDDEPEPCVDDEPEPCVDDEPEPFVDDFVDPDVSMGLDLSPIKDRDMSGHSIQVVTPERSSYSLEQSYVRELQTDSTPKTANRHYSIRNAGMLSDLSNNSDGGSYTKSDIGSYASRALSAPILTGNSSLGTLNKADCMDARSEISSGTGAFRPLLNMRSPNGIPDESNSISDKSIAMSSDITADIRSDARSDVTPLGMKNMGKIKNKPVLSHKAPFSDTCSDPSSGVLSSQNVKATSPASRRRAMTSISSRVNKVLHGRRSKRMSKISDKKDSTPNEKILAASLARRMLNGGMPEIHENKSQPVVVDEHIASSKSKPQPTIIEKDNTASLDTLPTTYLSGSVEGSADVIVKRDPRHFNSYCSSFDDRPPITSENRTIQPGTNRRVENEKQLFTRSPDNVVSLERHSLGDSPMDSEKISGKNSRDNPGAPPLMSWFNDTFPNMQIEKFASDITQKLDGANSVVSGMAGLDFTCGDGFDQNGAANPAYSNMRISSIDNQDVSYHEVHDDVPFDEEPSIEVEYVAAVEGRERLDTMGGSESNFGSIMSEGVDSTLIICPQSNENFNNVNGSQGNSGNQPLLNSSPKVSNLALDDPLLATGERVAFSRYNRKY